MSRMWSKPERFNEAFATLTLAEKDLAREVMETRESIMLKIVSVERQPDESLRIVRCELVTDRPLDLSRFRDDVTLEDKIVDGVGFEYLIGVPPVEAMTAAEAAERMAAFTAEPQRSKPILCLDFDGVIHSYTSKWTRADEVLDPPVRGALQFIVEAMDHFEVHIFSSRSHQPGGIEAMIQWLGYWSVSEEHGFPGDFDHGVWGALQWPTVKPPAMVTLDDRALTFNGDWPSMATLQRFKPWNKQ